LYGSLVYKYRVFLYLGAQKVFARKIHFQTHAYIKVSDGE